MLPYFEWTQISLGPLTIQVWGLMVSLGFVMGLVLAFYLAKKYFLSEQVVLDLALWVMVGGFIFARLFFVLFYSFDYFYQYPGDIIKIWLGGASSLGGFFGAGLAVYLFVKKRHFSWREIAPYLDIMTIGLWLGWAIGRIGCFFIHDHPGRLSSFFMAINFPGGARHDLGLYDALLAAVIFMIFACLFNRIIKSGRGMILLWSFVMYGWVRFWLDFLRATDLPGSDARYWLFTPMQWVVLILTGLLTFSWIWSKLRQAKDNGRIA